MPSITGGLNGAPAGRFLDVSGWVGVGRGIEPRSCSRRARDAAPTIAPTPAGGYSLFVGPRSGRPRRPTDGDRALVDVCGRTADVSGAQERLFGERGTKELHPGRSEGLSVHPVRAFSPAIGLKEGFRRCAGRTRRFLGRSADLQVTRFRPRVRALGGSRLPRGSFGVAVRWWPESAWGIRRRSL